MSGSSSDRTETERTERGNRDLPPTTPTRAAVRDCLDRVDDPELDRSLVELDYIDRIEIDDGSVEVAFTLPTAWCSPAFAWMMATDARDEIAALPDTESVRIELRDHMHETEITQGVNGGDSFGSVFPDADGDVSEVRATLDDKARFARQYEAIGACLDAGLDPRQIIDLRREELDLTDEDAVIAVGDIHVVVPVEPIVAFLEKARASGHVTDPGDRLFLTPDGEPIPRERFDILRNRMRLASVNMGGQGAVCDALNESRRAKLDRD